MAQFQGFHEVRVERIQKGIVEKKIVINDCRVEITVDFTAPLGNSKLGILKENVLTIDEGDRWRKLVFKEVTFSVVAEGSKSRAIAVVSIFIFPESR